MSPAVKTCAVHDDQRIVTECASCERDLCGLCWGHDVDEHPACDDCVAHLRERSPWVLPATFGAFAGLVVLYVLPEVLGPMTPTARDWTYGIALVVTALATYFLYRGERSAKLKRVIEERPRVEVDTPPELAGGPYRGRPVRRVVERVLPVWSGEITVVSVLAALGLSAFAVPWGTDLARWQQGLVVLGAWWLIWFATLFYILLRGRRVADDHGATSRLGVESPKGTLPGPRTLLEVVVAAFMITGPQGVLVGFAVAVVLAIPVFTSFGLSIVVPALFLGAYVVLGRGVRFAVNDAPACVGDPKASALRAAVFATTFTFPAAAIAGLAWLVLHYAR